ncbi:MAG: hypothetical protein M3Q82_04230 [Actinomycetota bacterium]|nr:hypothetical protein [Actinomycetota bacterium]
MVGRRGPSSWKSFGAWFVVGAAASLGALTVLSIGVVLLPIALIAIMLLAARPMTRRGVPGMVSGAGSPLLYVGYLNRRGPGTICSEIGSGVQCNDYRSPWLWFGLGAALVALGVARFIIVRRRGIPAAIPNPYPRPRNGQIS